MITKWSISHVRFRLKTPSRLTICNIKITCSLAMISAVGIIWLLPQVKIRNCTKRATTSSALRALFTIRTHQFELSTACKSEYSPAPAGMTGEQLILMSKDSDTGRTVRPFSTTHLAAKLARYGFTECSMLRAFILCICCDSPGIPELGYMRLKLRECLVHHDNGSDWFADLREAERWVAAACRTTCEQATDGPSASN